MVRLRYLAWSVTFLLPLSAGAQFVAPQKLDTGAPQVGGLQSMDLITLKALGPGTPLRFGNVIPGSESLELDGVRLERGKDYAIDNLAGVVYLTRSQRAGQTLRVDYRYDPKSVGSAAPSASFAGLTGLHYAISPAVNMLVGLGMAERGSDGTVLSSNSLGWKDAFSFGTGKMDGLFIVGQRDKQSNTAGLRMDLNGKPGDALTDDGRSQLLLQSYRTALVGGQIGFDYQDISQNFAGASQIKAAGYDDSTVNRLNAEKGLSRFGFQMSDLSIGGMKLSNSFRDVKDSNAGIQWRSLGVAENGVKLNWSSQRVDAGFGRFKDISEADRDQLAKEKGLSRENFSAAVGKFSLDTFSLTDDTSTSAINRKALNFDVAGTQFDVGDQSVSSGFNRFDSITGSEKSLYGREAGLNRQWFALNSAVMGKGSSLTLKQTDLLSTTGDFRARELGYKSKTWSLEHTENGSTGGFSNLASMQDAEIDGHVKAIASMYGSSPVGNDRQIFLQNSGIGRNYTNFQAEPFKSWNLGFNHLTVSSTTGDVSVDNAVVGNKKWNATFRHEGFSNNFADISRLMQFEQQKLGTISGLDRFDYGVAMNLSGGNKLALSRLVAAAPDGSANRTTANYSSRKIDVTIASREVDSGFAANGTLVDPEKDLLASLRGYAEKDAHVRWQILPNLDLDQVMFQGSNSSNSQGRTTDNTILNWAPNKSLKMNFTRLETRNTDPVSILFANLTQRISLTQDIGRYGKVEFSDEIQKFENLANDQNDSHTQFVAYETKIDGLTKIRTEQKHTSWSNGDHEIMQSETVSREISNRLGVSITDTQSKKNEENDDTKRNYGFWYDFGQGLRISYGYARDLIGQTAGTTNTTVTVGKTPTTVNPDQVNTVQPATVGAVAVGAGYGVNQWEATPGNQGRTQSFSNLSLGLIKPVALGPVKDLKFKLSVDTAADYTNWVRENQNFAVNGKMGRNELAYEYLSQIQANGDRGIDRMIKFTTDQSDKKWLKANIFYKERTLPNDVTFAIRDFDVTFKASKSVSLTNKIQTNPELPQSNVFLGSLPQASRSNKWSVDYKRSDRVTVGGSFEELLNDNTHSISRTVGLNCSLFGNTGSPVSAFFGEEQADSASTLRKTTYRYQLEYNQKAGPRQAFSFFLGNVSYANNFSQDLLRSNWTLRGNYQLKF